MTQQEIIEGNKLIAEFMGYDGVDCPNCKHTRDCNWLQCGLTPHEKDEQLKYHSSWDWLMHVVEKIESLGFYFNIKKNHVVVACDNKDTRDSEMIHSEWGDQSKIERVFQCAVAFVKYCNQNKSV